jgi:molecular chaperone GrpE
MNDVNKRPTDPFAPPDGEAPDSAAETEIGAVTAPEDEVARLTRERDDYLDQLQRARAEFANYQKRIRTQMDADRSYAVSQLAIDLLGPLDNFDRALDAARAAGAVPIIDGLTLVHRQLLDILAKHEIRPIDALGKPFDPNEHEAITQKPDPTVPEGTVVGELARGYKLRDRVLRPSRVIVSTP